jgi:uncharacterized protein (UPF0548 family)
MFTLTKPAAAAIEHQMATAAHLPAGSPKLLTFEHELEVDQVPADFFHDLSRSCLGQGESAFLAAKRAFQQWRMFDLGWVRVANPQALIVLGQIVAVEAHTLRLWTLNFSRITETVDLPAKFGFLYTTTEMHVEEGEERFLLEFDRETGEVRYKLEAVSRPRHALARLGFPMTRAFQHRFARDSHRHMREEVLANSSKAS